MKAGLQAAPPKLRQTVIHKRARAVGALLEAQTPHPSELATVLPVPTERQDIRAPGVRRLLTPPLLQSPGMVDPFARTVLAEAARQGQPGMLSLDQPALGDRCAVLRLAVRVGDRSLPVAWQGEAGAATIGFAGQQGLLDEFGRGGHRRPPCDGGETGSIPPPSCWPGCSGPVGSPASA